MANEYYIINPNSIDERQKRVNQIFEFLKDKQFYCAVAYAKVCKRREDEYSKYFEQKAEETETTAEELGIKFEEVNKKAEDFKIKVEYLENYPEEAKKKAEELNKKIEELKEKVKELEKNSEEADNKAEEFNKTIEELKEKVKELEKNSEEADNKAEQLNKTIEELKEKLKELDLEEVKKEAEELKQKAEKAYEEFKNAKEDANNFKNKFEVAKKYKYFNKFYTVLAYAFDAPDSNGCQYNNQIFDYIDNIDNINEDTDKIFEDKIIFKNFILLIIGIRILYSLDINDFDENFKNKIEQICDELSNDEFSISFIKNNVIEKIFKFMEETCVNLKTYSTKSKKEEIENKIEFKDNKPKYIIELKKLLPTSNVTLEEKIRTGIFENGRIGICLKQIFENKNVYIDDLKYFFKNEPKISNDFDIDDELDINNIDIFVEETYNSVKRNFPKGKNKENNNSLLAELKQEVSRAIKLVSFFAMKNIGELTFEDDLYIKMYDDILKCFNKAVDELDKISNNEDYNDEDDDYNYYDIGLSLLKYTVNEIENSFSRDKDFEDHKYEYACNFYIPFLITNDVTLKDQFLPDFPDFYFDKNFIPFSLDSDDKEIQELLKSIIPEGIIIEHANKFKNFDYKVGNINKRLDKRYSYEEEDCENYGILKLIAKYLGIPDYKNDNTLSKSKRNIENDEMSAEDGKQDFLGELELSHCYRQFDDVILLKDGKYNECDTKSFDIYLKIHENIDKWYKWACLDNCNYGIFLKIIERYSKIIEYNENKLEKYWQDKLEQDKKELKLTDLQINKISDLVKGHNYSAVSEVFDILPSLALEENKDKVDKYFERNESNKLNTFLADFIYDHELYFEFVKDDYLDFVGKVEDDENRKSAKKFVETWNKILSSDDTDLKEDDLRDFFKLLGFKIDEIENKPDIKFERGTSIQNYKNFVVTLEPKKRENVTHAIAAFGTKATKDGFRVVIVQKEKIRKFDKSWLLDFIRQIGTDSHTIILFNYRLSLPERRSLAKLIKIKCNSKLFIILDRVVMAFLMKKYNIDTINEMLMSVLVSFGFYQPYSFDPSNNNIPEEMFIGRDEELKAIEDPEGPSIVYGGRQLGKSALLRQAEKDINSRNDGSKALYIDINTKNYLGTVEKIVKDMKESNIFDNNLNITNWKVLASEIENLLKSKDKKELPYLLLLIDEADKFFESCKSEPVPNEPFVLIKNIRVKYTADRFKVVFAGLNMIIEYDFFTKDNSVLPHFKKQSVGPFKPIDARKLIERPLHYLGLDFSADKESLIYLILENTNYYPCLIQFYCEKLLKLMTKDKYAGYEEKYSPIYNVTKKHIREILKDSEFTKEVWDKLKITLELGNDDYYLYLAYILALMCHDEYKSYSKDDFKKFAINYSYGRIEKICDLDDTMLEKMLDQLVALEIFKQNESKYSFRRFRLFELIGTEEKIDNTEKIEERIKKINGKLRELMSKYKKS